MMTNLMKMLHFQQHIFILKQRCLFTRKIFNAKRGGERYDRGLAPVWAVELKASWVFDPQVGRLLRPP